MACRREVTHLKDYIIMVKIEHKSAGAEPNALSFTSEKRHELRVSLNSKVLCLLWEKIKKRQSYLTW